LNDRFDIIQSKKKATHLFFLVQACGTDRMKLDLSQAFKVILLMQLSQLKKILMQFMLPPKGQKQLFLF
jgi:hypothetical protein